MKIVTSYRLYLNSEHDGFEINAEVLFYTKDISMQKCCSVQRIYIKDIIKHAQQNAQSEHGLYDKENLCLFECKSNHLHKVM